MAYDIVQDIRETPIWELYIKGCNYCRQTGRYTDDSDRNYRFYNGNQWEGAKLGDVEPVQKNFIKPIVKYKVAVIHDNLYAIIYSSQNHENREFRKNAERYCEMLNSYAARVWEQDKLDYKGRKVTKDAAINDEGIIYVNFDREKMKPVNEIVKRLDIYYGDENEEDIQAQPFIIIRKRMSVSAAKELALSEGASEEDLRFIIGDNDSLDESGEAAKYEVDDKVTVLYKFYKEKGTVRFSIATRYIDIVEDVDIGISLYPIAHFNWEEKEGSARGEGEVRYLIPNQIEVNRTEIRRVLTVMYQAFPQKVALADKIANVAALNTVGGIIKITGNTVEDVHKAVGTLPPAQMSPDVVKLQEDLINVTRDLAGAGETATGQVDPESASGRAILAVQQASQAPMTEQRESYKNFVEDLARIWLEYIIVYAEDGINLEETVKDPNTGKDTIQMTKVPQSALKELQASVKIDITPKSVYDRFAQEQTIENLFVQGLFNAQRVSELEVYAEILDDDSVAPKQKILEAVERIKDEQRRIAMIQAEAQMMQQRAAQFLMGDPDSQGAQIADAESQLMAQMAAAEEGYAEEEAELDEEVAEEEEETDEE